MNYPIIRDLGLQDYYQVWMAMREFVDKRETDTPDEIWLVEHPPIFTLGQNGKHEHILNPGDIPVLQVDRGGQVTYHGPGQLVVYPLLDLKRLELGVRDLVRRLEQAVINFLDRYHIEGQIKADAPGVYVDQKKIGSLGLRIRRSCSFHGLSFNVAMDLEPFQRINPCGYKHLVMTQLSDLGGPASVAEVKELLLKDVIEVIYHDTIC